jgi:hypothetical protein
VPKPHAITDRRNKHGLVTRTATQLPGVRKQRGAAFPTAGIWAIAHRFSAFLLSVRQPVPGCLEARIDVVDALRSVL